MKKGFVVLGLVLCFLLVGCSNAAIAKADYDSVNAIAKKQDQYSKQTSVLNQIEDGYSLVVNKFDGRESIWTYYLTSDEEKEVELLLSLTDGKAKIVLVDEDKNVTTLLERTPETSSEERVSVKVSMPKGMNTFKVVGTGCENMSVEIVIPCEEEEN